MSMKLAAILAAAPAKKRNRDQVLALVPDKTYNDGRTLQCHKDECDISKIMARFEKTGTISHVNKFEPLYADYSDFDFHTHTRKLTEGRAIFAALPAELRREFNQDPEAFFAHVNHPDHVNEPFFGLPALAQPGTQLPRPANVNDADALAAAAAAEAPVASPPADSAGTQPEATSAST